MLIVLGLAAAPCVAQTQADPEREGVRPRAMKSAESPSVMVVAANPHATRAGLELLRAGGNAVDAALAALFVLNVVEPQSSGIGGGGFFLIRRSAGNRIAAIDGRETAPRAVTPTMFLQSDGTPQPFFPNRITGGRPVGVPGLLLAARLAQRRYGRLNLAQVLAPAIRLATRGFLVSPRLASGLERHRERLALFPATRAIYFRGDATLASGQRLQLPHLARTFRRIAADGVDVFYKGALARAIVKSVRGAPVNPGVMTLADLAAYRAVEREPVKGSYRGYTVYGVGPPTSGGITLIQILQLLEHRDLSAYAPQSPQTIHAFVQAVRLAYADRGRYVADSDQIPVPVRGLLSPEYAASRARELHWEAPLSPVRAGSPPGSRQARWGEGESPELASTTHLVVVDAARNIVSVTASVEQAFGSGMVVPGWGFFLNNQLTDFSSRPVDEMGAPVANRVAPGKRPRSSMAPTLVFRDGQPLLALGSPGGARIIQYVAWTLVQMLDFQRELQDAISAPHVTHLGGRTALEPPLAGSAPALEALGHKIQVREQNSGLHAIRIDPRSGRLQGGADPRREGVAAGY